MGRAQARACVIAGDGVIGPAQVLRESRIDGPWAAPHGRRAPAAGRRLPARAHRRPQRARSSPQKQCNTGCTDLYGSILYPYDQYKGLYTRLIKHVTVFIAEEEIVRRLFPLPLALLPHCLSGLAASYTATTLSYTCRSPRSQRALPRAKVGVY